MGNLKIGFINENGESVVRDMTPTEIAELEAQTEPTIWHYPRPMRVQVPMQLVRENDEKIKYGAVDNVYLSGLLTHMLATDTIQRRIENDTLYAYFDTIFEVHEAILMDKGITVENRPL